MKEQVRVLLMSQKCKDGPCPAIYLTNRRTVVFQGYDLDADVLAQLDIPRGEGAVEVPLDQAEELLIEALRRLQEAKQQIGAA